jgi:hypothetical protein
MQITVSDVSIALTLGYVQKKRAILLAIIRHNYVSTKGRISQLCFSYKISDITVAYPGIFVRGGSTNSVEDRGQRERGSGGGSPLVRGSTQFSNE